MRYSMVRPLHTLGIPLLVKRNYNYCLVLNLQNLLSVIAQIFALFGVERAHVYQFNWPGRQYFFWCFCADNDISIIVKTNKTLIKQMIDMR